MREKDEKKGSTVKVALIITIITICCKFLGFINNSILAYFFGTSPVVDAYVMTFSIGTITCGWIAGLIGNYTPVYKRIISKEGKQEGVLFSSNVHNCILLLAFLFVLLLELLAPQIVSMIAPGFKAETYNYTVHFFRLYLISIVFYASFRFFKEYLNCNLKHIWATAPDLLMSSCCIVSIVISSQIGESFLIYGYIVAVVFQCIIGRIGSKQFGYKDNLILRWDKNIKELLKLAIPIFLSSTLAEINILVDKMFASGLEEGMVASLDYANTMREFVYQLGTIAIITMIFPVLSELWAENKRNEFRDKIFSGIDFFTFLYVPLTFGILIGGEYVIDIVFKRGQFGSEAAQITTNAFKIYSISLVAIAYRSIYIKALHSMQKTKEIMMVSAINVILNICLNLLLVRQYGYVGLSLATSLSSILCIPVYTYFFKKTIKASYRESTIKFMKSLAASIIMYAILWLLNNYVIVFSDALIYQIIRLIINIIIGIIIYLSLSCLMKVEEGITFVNCIKRHQIPWKI